ncbi:MAG: hypothetical protein JWO63_1932 [Frankiales bacterium]|nr:hypothetical protein [Frankiales bacterium]
MSDADGSFAVTRTLTSGLRHAAMVRAQSAGCATEAVWNVTDAPPPSNSEPFPDQIGPALPGQPAPEHLQLAATLPTGGLGAQLFLGILALVALLAVSFLLIAGRAGRRTP